MKLVLIAFACSACGDVEGLKSEDIFGLEPNPKVWLYGSVTNGSTGAPLRDVAIQVEGYSTVSDARGAFRIDGLQAGNVQGTASIHGFQSYTLAATLRPGANAHNIVLQPRECGRFTCGAEQFCVADACVEAARLSGSVVDACSGAAISARVTIDGKSTCSSANSGKTYFELRGLTPGGPHTLSIGKTGYQAFSTQITLNAGLNAVDMIMLTPIGGCAAGSPQDVPCTCTQPTCQ